MATKYNYSQNLVEIDFDILEEQLGSLQDNNIDLMFNQYYFPQTLTNL